MTLDELQDWILAPSGLGDDLTLLSRYTAAKSVGVELLHADIAEYRPDWNRLLLAASILANAEKAAANEAALMIAHSGLLFSGSPSVVDASAALLTQLANHRAVKLAEGRGVLSENLEKRLGAAERMLFMRRELTQSIFLTKERTLYTNRFQRRFWDELARSGWTSASAPTASGKTFLVLQWLMNVT